ncbi:MAG: DUF1015 domain-containing protein, partial [Nonlabens sp.]|nr:DUF1015 domain-containing protein [Nonlabens sp.]
SYQLYDNEELENVLKYNPFSFLHILNPGYKFSHSLLGQERFAMVRNRYNEFKDEKHLLQDPNPAFYLYENATYKHSYTGIIAAAAVADSLNGKIKKHEDTLQHRVELFKDYLNTVGFNAEPVLLTYPDNTAVNEVIASVKQQNPVYDFETLDKVNHRLWVIDNPATISVLEDAFATMPELFIADGHHRTSSSELLAQEQQGDSYQYFMSYIIAESQLQITEFNRLIKDLNGLSKEEFLIKLDMVFRIQNRGLEIYKPSKKHHFSMYLDGDFYSLYLRKELLKPKSIIDELDTQLLYDTVLNPVLGIADLRNDDRIDYSSGVDDLLRMKMRVDSGEFSVGFGLVPVHVDELKAIATADLRMPPKSTYIRPKLPSGLTIYQFES